MAMRIMLQECIQKMNLSRLQMIVAIAVIYLSLPACTFAAEEKETENKVTMVIIGADRLLEDIEYMVNDLASRNKIWKEKVEENIELFLEGIDRKQPVRIDVFFDEKNGEFYRPFFPITDVKDFRNNVDAFGVTNKPISRDVYSLAGAFVGFMKIANDYALFAPEDQRASIDPNVPEIHAPIEPLKKADYDAGIIINHDKAGLEDRRKSMAAVRKNIISGIKKKSTESVEEFDFRKLLAVNRIDNFERLFSEVKHLEAGWITDASKKNGLGTLNISGIEGTDLAGTIAAIPDLKTSYHTIPETKDFVATGRMLFPISAANQEQIKATIQAYQPVASIRIDRKEDLNDKQKKAAKDAIAKLIPILEDGLTLGSIDGFVEFRRIDQEKSDSLHDMVAGMNAKSGRDIEEVIKMLPEIRDTYKTKMDTATVGDFHFHEFVLEDNVPPMFKSLFGSPCHFHIATSEKMVLFSIGENSKPWLEEMVDLVSKTKEQKAPENFFTFKGHFGPFAKALSARNPGENFVELRKAIIEAFSEKYTDDFIEIYDKQADGEIQGTLTVEPGLLRLLGILVANFADENL
ncbi:hypothetical protein Pan54_25460 [Rubinisphaera italica]|uniref:DUF3352 domain-containing protein n=2 Tax=Rubinisphaera italica TaxID=2527969 RepID=A0A5C5XGI3_9PLAN|nr:hypothetical protein Pan54_25460 [Rubinisphaera italica]